MVRLCFVILHSYYVEEEYINDVFKMIDNDNNSFYSLVNHMLETKDTEDYQKACLEYEKYQQISKALLRPIL